MLDSCKGLHIPNEFFQVLFLDLQEAAVLSYLLGISWKKQTNSFELDADELQINIGMTRSGLTSALQRLKLLGLVNPENRLCSNFQTVVIDLDYLHSKLAEEIVNAPLILNPKEFKDKFVILEAAQKRDKQNKSKKSTSRN